MNSRIPESTGEYGLHLSLSARVAATPEHLEDTVRIERFLKRLVERIGMRIMAGPIAAVEHGDPDRQGCSGVVILRESHAAIHTYSVVRRVFVDVFSCRMFFQSDVLNAIDESFGLIECDELHERNRGSHWRGEAAAALTAWHAQR